MKTIKVALTTSAFVFAFAASFASLNSAVIVGRYGTSTNCPTGNIEDACTLTTPTNNVRCKILSGPGVGQNAFSNSSTNCSVAIYKPAL